MFKDYSKGQTNYCHECQKFLAQIDEKDKLIAKLEGSVVLLKERNRIACNCIADIGDLLDMYMTEDQALTASLAGDTDENPRPCTHGVDGECSICKDIERSQEEELVCQDCQAEVIGDEPCRCPATEEKEPVEVEICFICLDPKSSCQCKPTPTGGE